MKWSSVTVRFFQARARGLGPAGRGELVAVGAVDTVAGSGDQVAEP